MPDGFRWPMTLREARRMGRGLGGQQSTCVLRECAGSAARWHIQGTPLRTGMDWHGK